MSVCFYPPHHHTLSKTNPVSIPIACDTCPVPVPSDRSECGSYKLTSKACINNVFRLIKGLSSNSFNMLAPERYHITQYAPRPTHCPG